MYSFIFTTKFKKDIKVCEKRSYDFLEIEKIFDYLEQTGTVPAKHKQHPLKGNYTDCMECHIKPDWLLIYRINKTTNEIELVRTGTHSDLFE